MSVQDFCQ